MELKRGPKAKITFWLSYEMILYHTQMLSNVVLQAMYPMFHVLKISWNIVVVVTEARKAL